MRLAVVGATGNVGTSLLRALVDDPSVSSIVGIARRLPDLTLPKTTWKTANVASDDLTPHVEGADALVHLAWAIQPSRDLDMVRRINVEGSRRVFDAAGKAGVPNLVYASSVGAYSKGPKTRAVDESWPTGGVPTSFYSRHKAAVERILDDFERVHPDTRVVRLRPGLIFKREAASGIRRLFIGPFLPNVMVRAALVPAIPDPGDLLFQCVHTADVAEAYRLAIVGNARGPFNIAADPVIGTEELEHVLGAPRLPVPPAVLRFAAAALWRLRLQPTPEGWVDMGLAAPIMDTARAQSELGWVPRYTSVEALQELLEGMRAGAAAPTPVLAPDMPAIRMRELLTGLGKRGP